MYNDFVVRFQTRDLHTGELGAWVNIFNVKPDEVDFLKNIFERSGCTTFSVVEKAV